MPEEVSDPSFPKPSVDSLPQQPRLGLVCITDSDEVRFRRITRKRMLGLNAQDRWNALLQLYGINLEILQRAITFCARNEIRLYRLTSHLFPFSDEPFGREVLLSLEAEVREAGRRFAQGRIRAVLHPDQFVVLSSDSPAVVDNSIVILENHGFILDLLEQPRSAWATITIHGGKGNRADQLVRAVGRLSHSVRARLALENDERTYSAEDIFEICCRAGLPMVFDVHHHLVHGRLDSYEHPSISEMLSRAQSTWPNKGWQLVHISNGRDALHDPRHHDVIHVMPSAYRRAPWIEVEAKRKEVAIEKLRAEWLL